MRATLSILILLPFISFSQTTIGWVNYPGGISVAADASNNVYTANWDYNPAGDITLTKRDDAGNILWEVSYDNVNTSRHEVATWVETDSQDNIIISGTIRSGYSNPVDANSLVMKYDPSGNLLWRVVYETDFDGSSTRKCRVDSQDNIYVLGFGNNGTGMTAQVKKISAAGTALWSYFDNAGIGKPVNFKFTPDQAIIISARAIYGSINGYAKIDLNGNAIWSYTGVNSLTAGDAAGDVYGNSYLVNGEYVPQNPGSVVTKLSTEGTVLWQQVNTMAGLRVEVGSDNFPVISGYPSSGLFGAAFMKYDENGNVLWQNLDADGPNYNLLAHAQMKLDGSDAAYLAASIMSQMAFCKVTNDGISEWTLVTSGSYAYSMDLGIDNSVFVTGGTTARIMQDSQTTSQKEFHAQNDETNVFPNPFTDKISVLTPEMDNPAMAFIYDNSGKLLYTFQLTGEQTEIELSALKSGIYFCRIKSDNFSQTVRLAKR
jgi:hypothetical protein